MLKAGADISDLTNDDIVRTDMKEFSEAGKTISIGQISVMDTTDVLANVPFLYLFLCMLESGIKQYQK